MFDGVAGNEHALMLSRGDVIYTVQQMIYGVEVALRPTACSLSFTVLSLMSLH